MIIKKCDSSTRQEMNICKISWRDFLHYTMHSFLRVLDLINVRFLDTAPLNFIRNVPVCVQILSMMRLI